MNQKNYINICNHKDCGDEGLYKAPLSKSNLSKHQWLCLNHVKEFNKSWNFHKEMGVEEIEIELRKDSTWRRPTKPFGSGSSFFSDIDLEEHFNEKSSKPIKDSNKLLWSLKILGLPMKSSVEEIKKNYKKLAKRFHPDAKNDIKNSDAKFRDVVEAYNYLLEFYKK